MKWLGKRATYADAVRLCKRWRVTRERLANNEDVERHLRIRGKILDEPGVRKIVAAGHAVIVSTLTHIFFCPGFVEYEGEPAGYLGINVVKGEPRSVLSWADMQRLLNLGYVWTIKR